METTLNKFFTSLGLGKGLSFASKENLEYWYRRVFNNTFVITIKEIEECRFEVKLENEDASEDYIVVLLDAVKSERGYRVTSIYAKQVLNLC